MQMIKKNGYVREIYLNSNRADGESITSLRLGKYGVGDGSYSYLILIWPANRDECPIFKSFSPSNPARKF